MLKKKIAILEKERDDFKIESDKMILASEEIIKKYKKIIDEKTKIADALISKMKTNVNASNIKNNDTLSFGEKLIAVNFMSIDKRINHSIICKSQIKFQEIENEFYSKYPEYKDNYFMYNGLQINKQKTLEENDIHGYVITMNKIR